MKSRRSRYVALDKADKRNVIAEGISASAVAAKAKRSGKHFSLLFVPPRGHTCVY